MEDNQKIDAMLNLSMDVTGGQRRKSRELGTGYDEETRTWQVIIRYTGDFEMIRAQFPDRPSQVLYNQFAILSLTREEIERLSSLLQVQFVEKPKQLYFSVETGRSVSCINRVQASGQSTYHLTGQGVLVAVIDSGIDYRHPAFRREDGSSRILYYLDQESGREYTESDLNAAMDVREKTDAVLPPTDTFRGHGTAVAGIAAGNGAGSAGRRYRGVAVDSDLLVVRLGSGGGDFPRTTEVMTALDYVVTRAVAIGRPVAVNLSFGNNYGAHDGQSLFERYIAELAQVWKSSIVIAAGNEGDARHHAQIRIGQQPQNVPFAIAERETNISIQIWKQYYDQMAIFIESPDGSIRQIERIAGSSRQYDMGNNRLLVYYGEPTPYTVSQEIYIEWITKPGQEFLTEGIWNILFIPEKILYGEVNLWLPGIEAVGMSTGFLQPTPDTTITIPASARGILSVGAYQAKQDIPAVFSGRGFTTDERIVPTLLAPGVGVITTVPGGGYDSRTGTSIAAPFVTGSAALLMEWGIVQGNDPYLYGEKIKAYLIRGCRPLPGFLEVPNSQTGWGALCLADSIPTT